MGLNEDIPLLDSWLLSLNGAGLSPNTIRNYTETLTFFYRWLGEPLDPADIQRRHIDAWLAELRRQGQQPTSLATRYTGLRAWFRWLDEEGEIDDNPMARIKAPHIPEKPTPILSEDELKRLFKALEGSSLEDRRDMAIIRLMLDTGMRVGEVASLTLDSLDLIHRLIRVQRKGGAVAEIPVGKKVARDLDRYIRMRRRDPRYANMPWLWVGVRRKYTRFAYGGIWQMIKRRGAQIGRPDMHPHQLRHQMANDWLAAGGQERDLMRIAGWKNPKQLARYGLAAADRRARLAHERLSPGDRF